ncbi:hypothetical protein AGABI2DRAFT_123416 [Agaricus bisporus var. bisporus H97]|uniref:hypothetical protein n=1 Tax=Agaricus bisporus var. bisporus (strain H97 / ATCC MYA-4626 / FGSC 10389) TaxID=936046 RepID=UPI00029F694C|nr:hypothetical protein AGABI2DRAFT_123416 [Agaricus bisporus var. bisporus H97]EKV41697.1 hypothetical protein AGABI2DRAFT_123416 [Agaricus bisporus var. bisporus H97]
MGSEILGCPVAAFLADYSPFLPNNTLIDAAIQALVRQQLLVTDKHCKTLFWKDFKNVPSSAVTESKVFKTFRDLAGIFNDEFGQLDGRRRYFFYHDCPDEDMKSENTGPNFRTYACFTGNPSQTSNKHMICAETAVVAEFKSTTACEDDMSHTPLTRSRSSLQNHKKLVSAANHVMNGDPCRMWMYGITIENTKMSVWYFSRSHSIKSETFDFTKDIRTFIQLFLSFVYATREQMGYDPTVHRIKDNEPRYVYEIPTDKGTRYFKTIHLLAYRKGHSITGRKTRVWKAVEVKGFKGNAINEELNGGKEVALKDVWLDEGSTTEKEKLDVIFECLRTIKEEAYAWAPKSLRSKLNDLFKDEGYRSYFMEIECDSFNLGRSKPTSDKAAEILQFSVEGAETREDSTQTTEHSHITEDDFKEANRLKANLKVKTRSYAVKRQYRLVYSEVGESLERVQTLQTAFTALMDTYVALVLMYLSGWMHRDVSAGNIIAVKRPGGKSGGKLSDLEYAKHYRDENASSDPKIGTAFFMPLEIHTGMPFRAPPSVDNSWARADIDPFSMSADQNIFFAPRPPPPRMRFRFQHDLESLWWVALYILIYRVRYDLGKTLSEKVFTRSHVPTVARRELFELAGVAQRELEESMLPALQHESIVRSMGFIRATLYKSYFMEEPVDPKVLDELYCDVFQLLALVVVTIKTKVPCITFQPNLIFESKKRVHSGISSLGRGDDKYKQVEERASDGAVPKKKKMTSTSTAVRL